MFMEIAIGAIGIGIVLMIGYVILSQVQTALPDMRTYNGSDYLANNVTNGMTSNLTTVFAGMGIVAVGIIILAAFGLINVFKN